MERWLKCKISPGQFTGEYAVQAEMFDGTQFSLFAPESSLQFEGTPSRERPIEGLIRVYIDDSDDNLFLVALPRPTFENGRSVTVQRGQLQPN